MGLWHDSVLSLMDSQCPDTVGASGTKGSREPRKGERGEAWESVLSALGIPHPLGLYVLSHR